MRALNTSGRAVLFAGGTVCIALLGLLVLRMSFLNGLSLASAMTVLITMAAAVTLLPALLGFIGMRVLSRRERRHSTTTAPGTCTSTGFWARWAALRRAASGRSWARPRPLLMLVLAVPYSRCGSGLSDAGNDPPARPRARPTTCSPRASAPASTDRCMLVAQIQRSSADQAALRRLEHALSTSRASPRSRRCRASRARRSRSSRSSRRPRRRTSKTSQLITHLRNDVIPPLEHGTTLRVYVGGSHGDLRRLRRGHQQQAAAVHRRHHRPRVPAAARGLPQPARAGHRGGHEPAGRRRVVRRARRVLPVGLGSEAARAGQAGPDRGLPAGDHARHPVRPVDGLPGLPRQPHARGVGAHRRQRARRDHRPGDHRTRHHRGRGDHDLRLPRLRSGRPARSSPSSASGSRRPCSSTRSSSAPCSCPSLMHLFGRATGGCRRWLDRRLPHLSVEPDEKPDGRQVPEPAAPVSADPEALQP